MAILLAFVTTSARAEPPPPPGGHNPISFGGANQGSYPPPPTTGVPDAALGAPSLAAITSAPNPFRGVTVIRFSLRQGERAELRVFDLAGRQVKEILHEAREAGPQAVPWDGRDDGGRRLASGVYFYAVKVGDRSVTRRLVLLR
jgi:hypothetical protein